MLTCKYPERPNRYPFRITHVSVWEAAKHPSLCIQIFSSANKAGILHQDKSFTGESFPELKTSEKINGAASLNIPKSWKRVKMKKNHWEQPTTLKASPCGMLEVFGRETSLGWRVLLNCRTVWNDLSVLKHQIQFSAVHPGMFVANVSQSQHTDFSGTILFSLLFIFGTNSEVVVFLELKL